MPRLPYRPEGFGHYLGSALNDPSEIDFSWEELCRASITVGRRSWADVLKFGTYSFLEALWRLAIVRANLVETPDGRLRQSSAFSSLDPSEKGGVSYFLGLALTKLVAEKLFQVPWLLHLDTYKEQLAPTLAFPAKPDFVGMDAWQVWIVGESKGRSCGISNALLDTAKRQVRSLRRIGGELPALRVVVATYFSGAVLRARLRDPETPDPAAVDIDLVPEQLARLYYRPVVEMITASGFPPPQRKAGDQVEIYAPLGGLDATLILEERIYSWYREGRPSWAAILEERRAGSSLLGEIRALGSLEESRLSEMGRDERRWGEFWAKRLQEIKRTGDDGVTVELGPSWNEEYMRREPEERAL